MKRAIGLILAILVFVSLFQGIQITADASVPYEKLDERIEKIYSEALGRSASGGERVEIAKAIKNGTIDEKLDFIKSLNFKENPELKNNFRRAMGLDVKSTNPIADYYMPSTGDAKALVIAVEFQDLTFTDEEETAIGSMFFGNADENNEDYPYESLKAYYSRSSSGRLNISGDVVSYTATKTRSSYNNIETLMIETLDAVNPNLSNYDADDSGYTDGVYLVYAGGTGEWASTWWSYVMTYSGSFYTNNNTAISSICVLGHKDTNTIIHETGHMLGLNDYYSYNESGVDIGTSDMMNVNYGDHNSYSKICLGWITQEEIKFIDSATSPENLTTTINKQNSQTGVKVAIAHKYTKQEDSYYLFEYIKKEDNFAYNNMGGTNRELRVFSINLNGDNTGNTVDRYPEIRYIGLAEGETLGIRDNVISYSYAEGNIPQYTGISCGDINLTEDNATFTISYTQAPADRPEIEAEIKTFLGISADLAFNSPGYWNENVVCYLRDSNGNKLFDLNSSRDSSNGPFDVNIVLNKSFQDNEDNTLVPGESYSIVIPENAFMAYWGVGSAMKVVEFVYSDPNTGIHQVGGGLNPDYVSPYVVLSDSEKSVGFAYIVENNGSYRIVIRNITFSGEYTDYICEISLGYLPSPNKYSLEVLPDGNLIYISNGLMIGFSKTGQYQGHVYLTVPYRTDAMLTTNGIYLDYGYYFDMDNGFQKIAEYAKTTPMYTLDSLNGKWVYPTSDGSYPKAEIYNNNYTGVESGHTLALAEGFTLYDICKAGDGYTAFFADSASDIYLSRLDANFRILETRKIAKLPGTALSTSGDYNTEIKRITKTASGYALNIMVTADGAYSDVYSYNYGCKAGDIVDFMLLLDNNFNIYESFVFDGYASVNEFTDGMIALGDAETCVFVKSPETSEKSETASIVTNDDYIVNENILSGVIPGTTVGELRSGISLNGGSASVVNPANNSIYADNTVCTEGSVVKVTAGDGNVNYYYIDTLEESTASGQCGDNATWSLYGNGLLKINGSGLIYDMNSYFGANTDYWFPYRESIKTVKFSDGITGIGGAAFANCGVEKVTIGAGITSIDGGAFAGCENLMLAIDSGNNDFKIEGELLYNSDKSILISSFGEIADITLPNTVKSIEPNAFSGSGIATVTFLGDAPGAEAAGLTKASFPSDTVVKYYRNTSGWEIDAGKWLGYNTQMLVPEYSAILNGNTVIFNFGDGDAPTEGLRLYAAIYDGDKLVEVVICETDGNNRNYTLAFDTASTEGNIVRVYATDEIYCPISSEIIPTE